MSVVIPFLTLLAGLLQYIIANRIDKSQIFRKRDKIRRRYEAKLLGIPSDKCLSTDARCLGLGYINNRLVVYKEFIKAHADGIPHILLHIQALIRLT